MAVARRSLPPTTHFWPRSLELYRSIEFSAARSSVCDSALFTSLLSLRMHVRSEQNTNFHLSTQACTLQSLTGLAEAESRWGSGVL